jgi:ribonuclease-3
LVERIIRQINNLWFSPEKQFAHRIKNLTGYVPLNLEIYQLSFKHSSAFGSLNENNERLELLGDAVIDLAVSDHIYHHFSTKSEGFLTEMRSKIVSRSMLNHIAMQMGLKDLIVRKASEADFRKSSIAGNTLEALVGAIYLDQGYKRSKSFVMKRMMKPYIDLADLQHTTVNFKSKLLEWCQKRQKRLTFSLIHEHREKNKWIYTMAAIVDGAQVGKGTDFSKKKAEQRASEMAIKALKIKLEE